jgi:hypothetical protein
LRGEPVATNTFDDDQAHLDEHTDYQMSATYQEAIRQPGTGPIVMQVFEAHTNEHRQKLQAAANQQAMAQAAQQALESGQPGPGPDAAAAVANGNGAVPTQGAP